MPMQKSRSYRGVRLPLLFGRFVTTLVAAMVLASPSFAEPDRAWAAALPDVLTAQLRVQLGDTDFTPRERSHVEIALNLRLSGTDVRRKRQMAMADGSRELRLPVAGLAEVRGMPPEQGHAIERAFPDHVDVVQDLVAKDDRLYLIWRWEGHQTEPFLGFAPQGLKVSSIQEAYYVFDGEGAIAEATYYADELDLAVQLQLPMRISKETARDYPIPELALAENNAPGPLGVGDDVLASLQSDAWPPQWPPIFSDTELQARLAATDYSEEERRNIKAVVLHLTVDPRTTALLEPIGGSSKIHYWAMDAFLSKLSGSVDEPGTGYSMASMPDRQQQIEEIIAKGDQIWTAWRWWGTHQGVWYKAAGDGRPILVHETALFRLEGGRLLDRTYRTDDVEIAQQIGLAIAIGETSE